MKTWTKIAAALAFIVGGAVSLEAQAAPINSTLRNLGREGTAARSVAPPLGFAIFCLNNPGECRRGGAETLRYSDALMGKLKRVNMSVNGRIRYTKDRADVWQVGTTKGDCEDYVLAKRRQLVRMGLPPSALRIAAVKTSRGEGHAILVVKTDRGDFVLDNMRSSIVSRHSTGYRWISMTSANPMRWVRA